MMKKRWILSVAAGMTSMALLAGCSSFEGNDPAITVGDTEITADVANFYARQAQAGYETYMSAYFGENMWKSEAGEGKSYEDSVKEAIQEELEEMVLLEKHMSDYGVSLSDSEKQVISTTAQEFDEDNTLEEKELISGEKEVVERVLTLMAIQQKMTEAIQADADTEVSDEEAAQKAMSYVMFSYKKTDEAGESIDLSDEEKKEVQEKAEQLAEGAKNGEDFAVLAEAAEVEVQTATFSSDSQSPHEDLIKAADALEEGGATGVIDTDEGCYVAKVTSLLDREATDAKKEEIVSERKTALYEETCNKWKEDAEITVHNRVWKKIDFNDLSVTMKVKEDVPYADEVTTDDQAADKEKGESQENKTE